MVSEKKKKIVQSLAKQIKEYPVIGVVSLEGMPAGALARMKKQLRDRVAFAMTRKRLILKAIEQEPKIKELTKYLTGVSGLILTKQNPFSVYKEIKQSKMKAPAKAGQTAPYDIIIPAGPTPFTPGPVISEFSALKVKASVEAGKVVVKADAVVAKEGATISAPLASMLGRLQIFPMEIGLNIKAVYENGIIYEKNVLNIDETEFMNNLTQSILAGTNLAVEIAWANKETITPLLSKAHSHAKALGMEAAITAPELMPDLLAKAEAQARAIQSP